MVSQVRTRISLEWGLSDSKHALTSEPENHFCYSQSMVSGLGASPIARRRYRQQFVGIASGIALVYLSAFVTMWWWESGHGPSPSGAIQLIAMGVLVAAGVLTAWHWPAWGFTAGISSLVLAVVGFSLGGSFWAGPQPDLHWLWLLTFGATSPFTIMLTASLIATGFLVQAASATSQVGLQ